MTPAQQHALARLVAHNAPLPATPHGDWGTLSGACMAACAQLGWVVYIGRQGRKLRRLYWITEHGRLALAQAEKGR